MLKPGPKKVLFWHSLCLPMVERWRSQSASSLRTRASHMVEVGVSPSWPNLQSLHPVRKPNWSRGIHTPSLSVFNVYTVCVYTIKYTYIYIYTYIYNYIHIYVHIRFGIWGVPIQMTKFFGATPFFELVNCASSNGLFSTRSRVKVRCRAKAAKSSLEGPFWKSRGIFSFLGPAHFPT